MYIGCTGQQRFQRNPCGSQESDTRHSGVPRRAGASKEAQSQATPNDQGAELHHEAQPEADRLLQTVRPGRQHECQPLGVQTGARGTFLSNRLVFSFSGVFDFSPIAANIIQYLHVFKFCVI